MSYIIVSEYLCDCIGHLNRVSEKKEEKEIQKEVKKVRSIKVETEAEEEVGIKGVKYSLV